MKIILLSDPASVHTIKWAKSLHDKGLDIYIFGLTNYDPDIYKNYPKIQIYSVGFDSSVVRKASGKFKKIKYLKVIPILKRIINEFKPHILHAHYASSYGLIGALSGFRPFIVSVWGTDIYDFPKKSFLHKKIIKYNLYRADKILSTSHVMATETNLYTNKKIEVTPFGIDLYRFKNRKVSSLFSKNDFVIGTIKTLEKIYGIEYLIHAFSKLRENNTKLSFKLLIVGSGSHELFLKKLSKDLGISNDTIFTGKVSHEEVVKYYNMLNICIISSVQESFGVAAIEASACEKPVIVSNVGGLPEVIEDGVTGIVVPPKDPEAIAKAVQKLIDNPKFIKTYGQNGRIRVKKLYNWEDNINLMINIYKDTINKL
ncbi:MAG: glycosyltransferase [Spirochaetia bacterium]|nr:glycosyltransferase [Spirochaetia bacterium]